MKIDRWNLDNGLAWSLLIGGLIGLAASLLLSIEVFNRLHDPTYVPVCNLSPVISCVSVADSPQSHLFGFPNYFLGLAAYAAVTTIGAAMLAGAKFRRWFWLGAQIGMSFAFAFISWLQFESLYRIGALCLFCMIVWAVTGPLFWYTSLYNLRHGHIKLPSSWSGFVSFIQRHHVDILVAWYILIIGLILKRFWYYWQSLF